MIRRAMFLWALVAMVLLSPAGQLKATPAQYDPPAISAALAAEEKEACTRNLKVIYDSIQAYQFDHKDLPNWLSDLVPDYLSDGNILICPVCRRTGRTEAPPLADPKLACSYVFEFCPVPVGPAVPGEPRHTRREWKRRQMGLVGSVVPMVRCRHHNPMLNLGFNGNVYESPDQWESILTNRVRTTELSLRAIFGGPAAEQAAPGPLANQAREPARHESSTPVHSIDLSGFYTSTLAESWLGDSGDDLALLPKGRQSFGGTQFEVGGVVQLQGESASLAKFPDVVKGIPVHQRCQHIYFLHAASGGEIADEGEQIGSYIVHLLTNRMTFEIPIYYGRTMRNWHEVQNEPKAGKELKIAWSGENSATKRTGKRVRLFLTAEDLAPGVEIDTLEFVSAGRKTAPFLIAISYD